MPTTVVNGARLAYLDTGSGSPVVWVHGGFTDRRGAAAVAPLLAARHRFVAYDRRGHGESEATPGRQDVAANVDDLAGLVEGLGLAPVHLLANSDGGEIALKLAVEQPELVATLCVHEPPLYGILPEPPDLGWLERAAAALERGDDEDATRIVIEEAALGAGAWEALPAEMRAVLVANAPAWRELARDPTYSRLDPDRLAQLATPTLLTVGEHSLPADTAIVARLGELVPGASVQVVPGAGHIPHRTHPDDYARLVLDFLERVSA